MINRTMVTGGGGGGGGYLAPGGGMWGGGGRGGMIVTTSGGCGHITSGTCFYEIILLYYLELMTNFTNKTF